MGSVDRATPELPARRLRTRAHRRAVVALNTIALESTPSWRMRAIVGALVLAWLLSSGALPCVRAQAADASYVAVQLVGEVDHAATLARISELVTPLGVQVHAVEGDSRAPLDDPPLARFVISRVAPSLVRVELVAPSGERTTRDVPLPSGRVDELAREAIATVCASSVQALLDARSTSAMAAAAEATQSPAPAQNAAFGDAAPSASPAGPPPPVPTTEVTQPATRDAPSSRPSNAADVPPERAPEPAARRSQRANAGELLFALGYELFVWGQGRVLYGPRLHGRYALPTRARLQFAFGFEASITLPSTQDESVFDVKLTTWSLRVLVEPQLRLSSHFVLALPAGIGLQVVTAQASAADSGARVGDDSQRVSLALVLRPTLLLQLGSTWTFALGAGLELHPMQVRYGLSHPDGFTGALTSSYLRPAFALDVGLRF